MSESQVFTHALKLAAPAARADYLDQACAGDPLLRAASSRVERSDAAGTRLVARRMMKPVVHLSEE
jgi:hypothetical protein